MAKEATKAVFGDDAWGKWATGVQERLEAAEREINEANGRIAELEKNSHVPVDFDPMLKRIDALEKAKPVAGKSATKAADGDTEGRLAALERVAGIHPVLEVAEDVAAVDSDAA